MYCTEYIYKIIRLKPPVFDLYKMSEIKVKKTIKKRLNPPKKTNTLGQIKYSFVSGRPGGQKKFDPGGRKKIIFAHKWKSK